MLFTFFYSFFTYIFGGIDRLMTRCTNLKVAAVILGRKTSIGSSLELLIEVFISFPKENVFVCVCVCTEAIGALTHSLAPYH